MNTSDQTLSPLKSHELLSKLNQLEIQLNSFSLEELSVSEAQLLKKSFIDFKGLLELKLKGKLLPVTKQSKDKIQETPKKDGQVKTSTNSTNEAELLIAHVSHDLRTPLNGIIGFTDLLKESKLDMDQMSHVNAITSASRHLLDVINELLEFSKLSSGKETFEMVDFNFHNLVQDVKYLCNTLVVNKKVLVKTALDPRIPSILKGDPSKLSQILLNLVGNAIKFVEKGTVTVSVELLGSKGQAHWLECRVKDTGIGIAEENLKHIFESFRQAEQNTYATYGGYGLGLSIVKQIVNQLGGDIHVNSTLGIGTTFTFHLPFEEGNTSAALERESAGPMGTMHQKELVKNMRILVFEDNTLNQRLIEERLRSWGCKVHITDNPNYGLTILKNSRVDLILMDLRMPIMDGFEVTRTIKNSTIPDASEIPIIAVTADFKLNDKKKCDAVGINDVILKPYNHQELLSKLIKYKMKREQSDTKSLSVPNDQDNGSLGSSNLTTLLDECMGQVGLLEELVQLFKQNTLEFIGKAKICLLNKDYEGLVFASHKMKPGLAMMHLEVPLETMGQLHTYAKEGKDMEKIALLYQAFVDQYQAIEKLIDQEVEKFKKS